MTTKTKYKIMSGLGCKVIVGFYCCCWSVCISLTLANEETNVDEFPLPMISLSFIFGTELTM